MDGIEADEVLDCYGLLCPMPIIQTAQKIKNMKIGEILEVVSTDDGIKEDMPAWCRQTEQEFIGIEEEEGVFKVFVRKVKES
ncbi:sulfurtransferase TusA family protein [Acidobacteriota bacterium]